MKSTEKTETITLNFKNYAYFNYEQTPFENSDLFKLGDVVINNNNEVGVIIQKHDKNEYRTDEFGNCCVDSFRLATMQEIKEFRPKLILDLKKEKIKEHIQDMLESSLKDINKNIEKALNSSAIDIDSWDENINQMILPKTILAAILQKETEYYFGKGTSFEKKIKKEVKNLRYFI